MKRKYGNSMEAVMAFRDRAAAELDALQNGQATGQAGGREAELEG